MCCPWFTHLIQHTGQSGHAEYCSCETTHQATQPTIKPLLHFASREVMTVLIFWYQTEPLGICSVRGYRGSLALSNSANPAQLVPLNYNNNGRTFSVHAGLSAVQNLFNTGQLSFLTSIGTLIEPIANKTEYNSGTKNSTWFVQSFWSDRTVADICASKQELPLVLRRMADILQDMNSIPEASMNISLAGKQVAIRQWTNEFSL